MCTDRQIDRHLDMQRCPLHSLIQGRLKKGLNRHTHTDFQMLIVESFPTVYGKSKYVMKMYLVYSLFVYTNITYQYSPLYNIHYTNNYCFQKSNGNLLYLLYIVWEFIVFHVCLNYSLKLFTVQLSLAKYSLPICIGLSDKNMLARITVYIQKRLISVLCYT